MTLTSVPSSPSLDFRPEPEGLEFDTISHTYVAANGNTPVLKDVRFSVGPGKVACVVGPSGCGKSTLLSLAAGLMAPTSGITRWRGQVVKPGTNLDLGMAFQQPGLFPWMTVRQNVAIGLTTRGTSKSEAAKRADEMLEAVGLTGFGNAYPRQLSGGMAQRVGIARALALRPKLLLMDEPFASVDAFTRLKLQAEFKSLLKLDNPAVLFVTHDVSEAILLGDVIVVMSPRPATVQKIIPIEREDRDRAGAGYAR
ncbi:MAG TPA: ABC transporter ATP-binding protein, partial [Tianweitania sediminis]|nr:ABC transporter ATP-binding protein [Tianweitania sediminis]